MWLHPRSVSPGKQADPDSKAPAPRAFEPTSFDAPPLSLSLLWQDYPQNPFSWANSLLVHLLVLTALLLPYGTHCLIAPPQITREFPDHWRIIPLTFPQLRGPDEKTGGGGGGGTQSPFPASRGAIPRFANEQYAPPAVKIPNLAPVLAVEPTLLGPPELKLPAMNEYSTWGDPHGVLGPASNGSGLGGGIGDGKGTGVGPGKGPGYGPGSDGGCCGDAFTVGGQVIGPVPIYKPEPAYSEEARKAKYSGTVTLWIVVDPQGSVRDIRLVKGVGMGLDEKAEEAVRTWKFKPGTRLGVPVAVRVMVEIAFRLF